MNGVSLHRKCATPFTAHSSPTLFTVDDRLHLGWVDPATRTFVVAQAGDLPSFATPVDLGIRPLVAPSVAVSRNTVLVAWPDRRTSEVMVVRCTPSLEVGEPVALGIQSPVPLGLAHVDDGFVLVAARAGDGRILVSRSADGETWLRAEEQEEATDSAPCVVAHGGRAVLTWIDRAGRVLERDLGAMTRPRMVEPGPVSGHATTVHAGRILVACSRATTDEVVVVSDTETGVWKREAVLHARTTGSPATASCAGRLGLAWTRPALHGAGHVEVAVSEPADAPSRGAVFTGNVTGHPTALDPQHHTPYPYLGLLVLPSDMSAPKAKTEAELVTDLEDKLAVAQDFWAEASYGRVDITAHVHPSILRLPSPMSSYLVRARPRIIDGSGVTYPVTFQGGETLQLAGAADYAMTTTFAAGAHTLDQVVKAINAAITATPFAGPAKATPVAETSETKQLRICTTGPVDPGTTLSVTGGTAVDLLGLGAGAVTVYEGSKAQPPHHLDQMLRDALVAVVGSSPAPLTYLQQFFGVVICIASDLGWYTIRAEATRFAVPVVEGSPAYVSHQVFITPLYEAETYLHEIGHNLGLPDYYEDQGFARFLGAEPQTWDLMDSGPRAHPLAWGKAVQCSWMGEEHLTVLTPQAQSVEAIILPNECAFPGVNPFAESHPGVPICHAIKIPLDQDRAYFVENRQKGPFTHPTLGSVENSMHLPGSGIVLTDTTRDVQATHLERSHVVLVHPIGKPLADVPDSVLDTVWASPAKADKLFALAPYVPDEIPQSVADDLSEAGSRSQLDDFLRSHQDWQTRSCYPLTTVGEDAVLYQFPDGDGDIRVKIQQVIGDAVPYAYKVRATWGRAGNWFDLEIRPWRPDGLWESEDIWIDSEENGWDVYEHTDAARNPDVPGSPVLNGDRPWVGHVNRVYARIWNRGDIAKNNVQVTFEQVVPAGQASGIVIDRTHVDLPAGGYAIAQGTWKPVATPPHEHGCITATVQYQPWDLDAHDVGELNANNNSAQENVGDFYVESGSPYREVTLPFEFANPVADTVDLMMDVRGLVPGWSVEVRPYVLTLAPGERVEGEAILRAADTVPLEDPQEGFPAPTVSLDALVRTGCTWERVGGLSMICHAVRHAELHAGVDPSGNGVHVTAQAATSHGPVRQAGLATRVLDARGETLRVERTMTDDTGHAHVFIPLDMPRTGVRMTVEVRLAAAQKSGPAAVEVPFER